jgi:hypothetical protein
VADQKGSLFAVRARCSGPADIPVAEFLLAEGDEIEAVGYKSSTVDLMVSNRLERETPLRAGLRGGKLLPLTIAPVQSGERTAKGRKVRRLP